MYRRPLPPDVGVLTQKVMPGTTVLRWLYSGLKVFLDGLEQELNNER